MIRLSFAFILTWGTAIAHNYSDERKSQFFICLAPIFGLVFLCLFDVYLSSFLNSEFLFIHLNALLTCPIIENTLTPESYFSWNHCLLIFKDPTAVLWVIKMANLSGHKSSNRQNKIRKVAGITVISQASPPPGAKGNMFSQIALTTEQ